MYDPKQEPHEFVAESREAAVAKARAFFGLEGDALLVHELVPGEVYGLGGRTAVVAVPRDRRPAARAERGGERDRERGGRERGGRGDRGRREGRGERGGRERGGRDRERGREAPKAREELSSEPSVGTVQGELGEVGRFVLGAIERLGVGPFEIAETGEDEITVVEVKGPAARALAGGEARAIDALQLLANQVAARLSEEPGRVVLDVEGGWESRERHLERLAERAVRRAREGGRTVGLDPMNGRDRRVIHLAIRDEEGVASMSIGEGRYRQVVIVPEGAPEYEEAVRQSESASDRRQ